MALDFPASPTQGQTFQDPATGIVWVFDSGKWRGGAGGGAYLPLSGGTLTGSLAGTTGAFSGVVSGADPPAGDSSGKLATTAWINNNRPQNRNRLINGDFHVDQYNSANQITPANTAYVADRWAYGASQANKLNSQVQSGGGLGITVAVAAILAANDYFMFTQIIEWINIWDCFFGQAPAQPLTLSFQVYATIAGTYSGAITNGAFTRSYPFTFSVSQANTWTSVVITIPGDPVGTWAVAVNAAGMVVRFDFGSGANMRGSAGVWANGNYVGANGAASLITTAGANMYFRNIQLELGAQATPFDWRPYGEELALCQRYYVNAGGVNVSGNSLGSNIWLSWTAPVVMRAAPTIIGNVSTGTNSTAFSLSPEPDNRTVTGGLSPNNPSLNATGYMAIQALNAEL